MSRRRGLVLGLILAILVAALFLASLGIGRAPLTLLDLLLGAEGTDPEIAGIVLTEIRLPRAILAVMIGSALGLSGAVLQGYLRNPLAEPGLVGASSMAALGAVIALYTGLAAALPWTLPAGGILGALIGVSVVHLLAGRSASPTVLILAGVAVNSLAGALTSLALSLAPSPFAMQEIVFWLLGSLADRSFDHVMLALPFMLAGGVLLAATGRGLEALTLGSDAASSLGVSLDRLQIQVALGTALAVGAAVAVSGAIGFIGLVVPHLLRPLVGWRPAALLPVSALGGAALALAADIAARVLSEDAELNLGVVTAMVGAPFFIYLLLSTRRQMG
jgi:iron complex transport system permease protein